MTATRAERVASAFLDMASNDPRVGLCTVSAALLDASSASVCLMSGTNSAPVCSSNGLANELERLQFTLGEGPCRDAFETGLPVSEPDLLEPRTRRWSNFTPPALVIGARSVFAFPLIAGRTRIGVLTLYQVAAGELTEEQSADAPVVADAVARSMLAIQSRGDAGVLAAELSDTRAHRAEVHQAAG